MVICLFLYFVTLYWLCEAIYILMSGSFLRKMNLYQFDIFLELLVEIIALPCLIILVVLFCVSGIVGH